MAWGRDRSDSLGKDLSTRSVDILDEDPSLEDGMKYSPSSATALACEKVFAFQCDSPGLRNTTSEKSYGRLQSMSARKEELSRLAWGRMMAPPSRWIHRRSSPSSSPLRSGMRLWSALVKERTGFRATGSWFQSEGRGLNLKVAKEGEGFN